MAELIVNAECRVCDGTGLYSGMAERDGFAVVCHRCKGSGCETITVKYDLFTARKESPDTVRVLKANPGIMVGGKEGLERFGGMPYEEWAQGLPFPAGSEMREFTCPAWWVQSAENSNLKGDWCHGSLGSTFSSCECFSSKVQCWNRYDNEL